MITRDRSPSLHIAPRVLEDVAALTSHSKGQLSRAAVKSSKGTPQILQATGRGQPAKTAASADGGLLLLWLSFASRPFSSASCSCN